MTHIINCQSISKSFGIQTLFTDISLVLHNHERVGLIGPNGSGKSTFLKILSGIEDADRGEVIRKKFLKVAYLAQSDQIEPGQSVFGVLMDSLKNEDMDDARRYKKATQMAGQAGFKDKDIKVGNLSGGWKKRLAISCVLVQEPDLLLLDEPTNHLDLEGIIWLETFLSNPSLTFVVISHDRYFLEKATNQTLELNKCYPDGYLKTGKSYFDHLEAKRTFLEIQAKHESSLSNRVRREIEWLRQGPKARTTKAKYRIGEAEKLQDKLVEIRARNTVDRRIEIDFTATGRKTRNLIKIESMGKTMGPVSLFKGITHVLSPGVCLGLVGGNGTGKTTFIRLLGKAIKPDAGRITWADRLRVVTFHQEREKLDMSLTLRRALSPDSDNLIYRGRSIHVVTYAKKFLFRVDQLDMPVSRLSGGEHARILIARLMREPADVLLLDEPTNDLDIQALEVLEQNLIDFPGAIVLATHDRSLLDRVARQILGFDGSGAAEFYSDCAQWIQAMKKQEKAGGKKKNHPGKRAPAVKSGKPAQKLSNKEKFELEQMEGRILEAEEEVRRIERTLSEPETAQSSDLLNQLCSDLKTAQEKTERLYTRWEELEAKREKLGG